MHIKTRHLFEENKCMAGIEEASWTHVTSTEHMIRMVFFITSTISVNLNRKAKGDPTHHQGFATVNLQT